MISKLRFTSGLLLALGLVSCAAPRELCQQHPQRLSAGSQETTVCSACLWNDTGIQVRRGQRYALRPTGTWVDWMLHCDASGPISPFGRLLMMPSRPGLRFPPARDRRAHFFSLIVCLRTEPGLPAKVPTDAFLVPEGQVTHWTAPADGHLLAFANDWKSAYGNNKGALTLRVTPVK